MGKTSLRANLLNPGDTVEGLGTVKTVDTAPHHDVVVRFTNGKVRRFMPNERLTILH